MNLREVRQAATRLHNGWHSQSPKLLGDYETVCDFVLATIDPEPDAAITSDWLQEVWGLDIDDDNTIRQRDIKGTLLLNDGGHGVLLWWHHGVKIATITTRQQFCDLARALGIQRKDGAK